MKPNEGRFRVIIEEVQPEIDCGRYPAKRILGDIVTVTAAIFADGHDHVAGAPALSACLRAQVADRTLYRRSPTICGLPAFPSTSSALGSFTIEAWVDHFDTWLSDLDKRLAAQPDPKEPTQQVTPQDIPLALRIGANLLDAAAARAKGPDAKKLKSAAAAARDRSPMAALPFYDHPITDELVALVAKYPDLTSRDKVSHANSPSGSTASAPASPPGTSCSPVPASPDTRPARHLRATSKPACRKSPRWASTSSTCRPSTPSASPSAKAKTTPSQRSPAMTAAPGPSAHAEGGHTAIHPRARHLRRLRPPRQGHAGATAWKSPSTSPSSARPTIPGSPSILTGSSIRPDGTIQYAENPPKKYQDIYPLNFESHDWRGLWEALYGVFQFWIDRGVTRLPRRQSAHQGPALLGVVHRRNPEAHARRRLPRRSLHAPARHVLARQGRLHPGLHLLHLAQYQGATCRTTSKRSATLPSRDFFRPNVWPNTPDILHEQLQDRRPARCSCCAPFSPPRSPPTRASTVPPSSSAKAVLQSLRPARPAAKNTSTARSIRSATGTAPTLSPSLRSLPSSTRFAAPTPPSSATSTSGSTRSPTTICWSTRNPPTPVSTTRGTLSTPPPHPARTPSSSWSTSIRKMSKPAGSTFASTNSACPGRAASM